MSIWRLISDDSGFMKRGARLGGTASHPRRRRAAAAGRRQRRRCAAVSLSFENRPLSGAQTALRMTQARYDLACATLQQLGLWPQEARTHLDASQAPVYTEQDVIHETRTSREFEAITGETQRRLGRVLSNEELKNPAVDLPLSGASRRGHFDPRQLLHPAAAFARHFADAVAAVNRKGSVLLGRPRHRHDGAGSGLYAEPASAAVAAGQDPGAVRHYGPQADDGRGELYPDVALVGLRRTGNRPCL